MCSLYLSGTSRAPRFPADLIQDENQEKKPERVRSGIVGVWPFKALARHMGDVTESLFEGGGISGGPPLLELEEWGLREWGAQSGQGFPAGSLHDGGWEGAGAAAPPGWPQRPPEVCLVRSCPSGRRGVSEGTYLRAAGGARVPVRPGRAWCGLG